MSVKLNDVQQALSSYKRQSMQIDGFRDAAVLVPVLDAPDGLELLFTVRSSQLSSHAGQISFPGGRLDDGETVLTGARRETFEEIGIEVAEDAVLGYLSDHPSPAKYVVTPVVAAVPWPQTMTINPAEVEEVFTVPLAALNKLEPRTKQVIFREYERTLHFYDWKDKVIWGLTGNLVKNLLDMLY